MLWCFGALVLCIKPTTPRPREKSFFKIKCELSGRKCAPRGIRQEMCPARHKLKWLNGAACVMVPCAKGHVALSLPSWSSSRSGSIRSPIVMPFRVDPQSHSDAPVGIRERKAGKEQQNECKEEEVGARHGVGA